MDGDFALTGTNAALDERIKKNYFICVEKCDQYSARTKIEGRKIMGKESGELEIETSYTPYIIAKANYRIIYLRRNRYGMSVPSDVDSVQVLNRNFINSEIINHEIKVDAIEKIIIERGDSIELNQKGNRIKFKDIPPHNKVGSSFYEEHKKAIVRPKFDVGDIIQQLRDKLVSRPIDVSRSIEEIFTVDVQVILRTYYTGTFKDEEKEKKFRVDSVTGKVESI
ncbi:MAG: hypothetical protein HWN66_11965 [Candidatus Helarchaeota archaeon]|nr:hypothetical protein [Candidatus Helarchaeota archaeon]